MSQILGGGVRNFDATYRRYAPADAVREINGRLYFHAQVLIREMVKAKAPSPAKTDADPLLAGDDDSPALEEYRKARARLAWMEVEQREKTHLPLATLEPALMQLTGLMRRAGDRLARSYGNDAAAVLNEAVGQWEDSLETILSIADEPDPAAAEADRAEHPHAAPADDA